MTKVTKTPNSSQVTALGTTSTESTSHEQGLLMPSKPLKVLITRPKAKAQQLALLLNQQGIANTCQTLFDYKNNTCTEDINAALQQADILIFVSVAAVEFTHASYPINNQLPHTIFAVGNATKQALLSLGINKVLSPPVQQEHSEGLLKLAELAAVKGKEVVIFRGNGGREHIATTLRQRGAKVSYIESYQRVWRTLDKNIAQQWQAQQINCIVVTSNDILTVLLKTLACATDNTDNYWQSDCLWLVISDRIENNAKAAGLTRVLNAHSASSKTLSDTLQTLSDL